MDEELDIHTKLDFTDEELEILCDILSWFITYKIKEIQNDEIYNITQLYRKVLKACNGMDQ